MFTTGPGRSSQSLFAAERGLPTEIMPNRPRIQPQRIDQPADRLRPPGDTRDQPQDADGNIDESCRLSEMTPQRLDQFADGQRFAICDVVNGLAHARVLSEFEQRIGEVSDEYQAAWRRCPPKRQRNATRNGRHQALEIAGNTRTIDERTPDGNALSLKAGREQFQRHLGLSLRNTIRIERSRHVALAQRSADIALGQRLHAAHVHEPAATVPIRSLCQPQCSVYIGTAIRIQQLRLVTSELMHACCSVHHGIDLAHSPRIAD
ncbi:hypothetical protein WI90_06580 [Burkholderia ubonensis]|nr:hypothetical protein WI90_06580 [Burkholderia ubonensis]